MLTINLASAPEIKRIILAADPSYRKRQVFVHIKETVQLNNTYWDGGSRSTYTAVNLSTGRAGAAPQYAPPQFGGPREAPTVPVPDGVAIVETGIFCGKTATASVTINAKSVFPSLTATA